MEEKQRLRDPIHGLIVFEKDNIIDQLAWELIQTQEFQRLRRIKQLGMSEFVFPSATHTRLAHSIGVYHNARKLMAVVKREEKGKFDSERELVTLIAALLHDVGHGPFSHTFEGAREAIAQRRGIDAIDKHEKYSSAIIKAQDGEIFHILEKHKFGLAAKVASLIESDDPVDIYHAVVSSSFDADRLDYLVRDRYMTGTQTGGIDQEWLIDNLTKRSIVSGQDDDADPLVVPTFVFKSKGRHAAEDFLLARYRLYLQVYLHKTTRGFEKVLSSLLELVGSDEISAEELNLPPLHPLIQFLRPNGENLENYRLLDDTVVWGAMSLMSQSKNRRIAALTRRILDRKRPAVLDVTAEYGHDRLKLLNAVERLDDFARDRLGQTIFKDDPPYNIYSKIGGEETKAHKMVRVETGDGGSREITDFSETILNKSLMDKPKLARYYFLEESDRADAEKAMRGR